MRIGHPEMAEKRASRKTKSPRVNGHPPGRAQTELRVGLCARVSTHDQQTIPQTGGICNDQMEST
jgi:hypothetical protein